MGLSGFRSCLESIILSSTWLHIAVSGSEYYGWQVRDLTLRGFILYGCQSRLLRTYPLFRGFEISSQNENKSTQLGLVPNWFLIACINVQKHDLETTNFILLFCREKEQLISMYMFEWHIYGRWKSSKYSKPPVPS